MSSSSLLGLVTPPGAAVGTGLLPILQTLEGSSSALGSSLDSPAILDQVLAGLPGLFGDFPMHDDIAPSAIFVAVYSLLALGHFFVFARGSSRRHYFYASFGLGVYCLFRVIGFGLRINWAQDTLRLKVGIASTVFSLVSVLYVNTMNVLLAHRIFTWRHPETGTSRGFYAIMCLIYFVVIGVIVMAILGQAIPYIYFLSESHFNMCKKVTRAAAVIELFYALGGLILIGVAFAIPAGKVDHRFFRFSKAEARENLPPTFQPTWIKSTGIFYYPEKGSQRIVYKDEELSKAIRIMPSQAPPASGLVEMQHEPHHNGPRIRVAVTMIVVTSTVLVINCCFRLASTFTNRARGGTATEPFSSFIFRNYIFYIFYGALEALVNVAYLVGRVDLRFYIGDMPKSRGADSASPAVSSVTSADSENLNGAEKQEA